MMATSVIAPLRFAPGRSDLLAMTEKSALDPTPDLSMIARGVNERLITDD
jgi:hypothetical protein